MTSDVASGFGEDALARPREEPEAAIAVPAATRDDRVLVVSRGPWSITLPSGAPGPAVP
jgi:hypothetical protein